MAESDQQPKDGGVLAQLGSLWKKLSPRRRAILVAAVVGTIVLVFAMSLGSSVEPYEPLFTGLEQDEAGEIVASLKASNTPYRLAHGGTVIEVPADKLDSVRLDMATAGFPRGGGVGFEIFDKQNFGTTSFVEQVNYRRALQGELSRSIISIDAVKTARVHLAMGKRSVFRESDEPPSASVALHLRRGRQLSETEVQGIVNLVASSVDGLEPAKVVVINEKGKVLSRVGDPAAVGNDLQNKLEGDLQNRVRRMVEAIVGAGNAAVVVTAEIDHSRVDKTEEMYDKNNIAVRSEVRNVNKEGSGGANVGGIAGARANLDGTGTTQGADGPSANSSLSETRNYEVPRVVTRTIGPTSSIERLHVAVLVNHKEVDVPIEPAKEEGSDKPAKKKKKAKDKDKDEAPAEPKTKKERVPLTQEELQVITAIASQAAGLNAERGDKIEVRNVLFETDEVESVDEKLDAAILPRFSKNMFYAASAVAGLLLLGIVLFLIRRSPSGRVAPLVALPAPVSEVERVLEARRAKPELTSGKSAEEGPPESQNGDLYGRVVATVRSDAAHTARVLSALLDDTSKEGA